MQVIQSICFFLLVSASLSWSQLCPSLNCSGGAFFGSAQIWNVVTFRGDFVEIANTDITGRALINGDFTMGNGMGDRLYPSGTTCAELAAEGCPATTLAVLGRISWPDQGEVQNGNVLYTDSTSDLSNMGFSETCEAEILSAGAIDSIVNYTAVFADLQAAYNRECANNQSTGTIKSKFTTMTLTGSNVAGAAERFYIPVTRLTGINTINLQGVNDPLSVVIVVQGDNNLLNLNNIGLTGLFGSNTIASRVVWVFCNVPGLNLFAVGIRGSILAIETDLMGTNGDIYGNVFVRSFEGFLQFSYLPSTACNVPVPVPVVIYNSNILPYPYNIPSRGFECCQISEVGDHIIFAPGTPRLLTSAIVTFSSWALFSDYNNTLPWSTDPTGWNQTITLNLYSVVGNTLGPLLGSVTQVFHAPYRPAEDPVNCPIKDSPGYPYKWQAPNGNCYNGFAWQATFDLSGLNLVAPEELVWGIAFNTQTSGYNATGVPGPYNSLNVGTRGNATIGAQYDPDGQWANSLSGGQYCSAGPLGVFRADTGCWTDYAPEITFYALPALDQSIVKYTKLSHSKLLQQLKH